MIIIDSKPISLMYVLIILMDFYLIIELLVNWAAIRNINISVTKFNILVKFVMLK